MCLCVSVYSCVTVYMCVVDCICVCLCEYTYKRLSLPLRFGVRMENGRRDGLAYQTFLELPGIAGKS